MICITGCQEEKTGNNTIPENITIESDVVDLVFADFIEHKESGNIIRVEVQYLFRNIVSRNINVLVYFEFYDYEDNLLYTSENKTANYPEGHIDENINPLWSSVLYDGDDADKVDYVKIIVNEY
jgi:hypothetical protein